MTSSKPPKFKGIIFDANVLSLLAKENHLDLLPQYFPQSLYVTSAIRHELQVGLQNGVSYLRDVLQLIEDDLQIVTPTEPERQLRRFGNSR